MSTTTENNKRIAKNTMLLYVRMLIMMCVSLYTSRVVLNALGVADFGLYNVVGGFVAMFSLFSGSLSSAIIRFITFELGKDNKEGLKKIFSSSLTIQIGLSFLIIVLSETIGVWFLNTQMIIPPGRETAANWVFQFSLLTFVINLISLPYNAAIIAHEKMSAFAYISIIEAVGKLLIAFLIMISPIDRLIYYSSLMCLMAIILRLIYGFYCKKHFEECTYHFIWDKKLLSKMFSFAGWNFLGTGSFLFMTQGVNILMNIFFGVTLNTARSVANQVDSAVQQFVNNFTTAINPQITKSYAAGDLDYMHKLVCLGSKYSFFLTWIFALPILLETDIILKLWLKTVPGYAALFLRLTICISLISVISNTLVTSMLATGNIKRYQIIVGGLGMLVFPLAYIAYKLGLSPENSYYIQFAIFVAQLVVRLFLLRQMIKLKIATFLHYAIFKDIKVLLASLIIPLTVTLLVKGSLMRFIIVTLLSIILTFCSIYLLGLSPNERSMIKRYTSKIRYKI